MAIRPPYTIGMAEIDELLAELDEARVAAGLSQRALATLLGVSQATVSRWLAGEIGLPAERLAALAAAVGVRLTLAR